MCVTDSSPQVTGIIWGYVIHLQSPTQIAAVITKLSCRTKNNASLNYVEPRTSGRSGDADRSPDSGAGSRARAAARQLHVAAAIDRWDRQTDRRYIDAYDILCGQRQ